MMIVNYVYKIINMNQSKEYAPCSMYFRYLLRYILRYC